MLAPRVVTARVLVALGDSCTSQPESRLLGNQKFEIVKCDVVLKCKRSFVVAGVAVQGDERAPELHGDGEHLLDVRRGTLPPQQGRRVRVQQGGALQDIPYHRLG